MKKIYLAVPYSHPDPDVRADRAAMADCVAAQLFCAGNIVYSPISGWHGVATKHRLPTDWDTWQRHDESFLDWCDEVTVICAPGWEESTGVTAERQYAEKRGKPISFVNPPWEDKANDQAKKGVEIAG